MFSIDTGKIKTEAREKARENDAFRQFIRQFKSPDFDAVFHRIATEVTAAIDCTQCGNCCRSLHPAVREDEVERIAACRRQTTETFTAAHLELSETRDYFVLSKPPCIFLDGNRCSIYENRPASCADYPHLISPDQKFRMRRILDQYGVCPIVYHTVEQVKSELGFAFGS